MDYSKFYLKNYVPEPDNDNDMPEIPRIETHSLPEIIYINPDGEVFDPGIQNSSQNESTNSGALSEPEDKVAIPEVVRKPHVSKQSALNRFCQATLIFAIIVMSLIVSADFVTNGKAIAAITGAFTPSVQNYYAVLTNPREDLATCKADSYAMRLKGGAGFVVKNGDNYYNVYAIFDNESDAEEYINQNGGETLTLTTNYYDEIDGELKNYIDYPVKTCESLNDVLTKLADRDITTSEALDKLEDIKNDFAVTYDNMNNAANGNESGKSLSLLANASVALSALDYLCDTSVSRPNLACDIRYTVCVILFTYCYSE